MKRNAIMCAVAILCSAGLAAAQTETKTESKITVKGGKDVTVTGCVERTASGNGYLLSHVADKSGALHNYMLTNDDDVSKHVGHRLQVKGKVADQGDAKIETKTTTKVEVEDGKDQETKTKTKAEGNLGALPFLTVESIKMIAAACP